MKFSEFLELKELAVSGMDENVPCPWFTCAKCGFRFKVLNKGDEKVFEDNNEPIECECGGKIWSWN